eukprot:6680108-Pyramimonas_sp.AAC.1
MSPTKHLVLFLHRAPHWHWSRTTSKNHPRPSSSRRAGAFKAHERLGFSSIQGTPWDTHVRMS